MPQGIAGGGRQGNGSAAGQPVVAGGASGINHGVAGATQHFVRKQNTAWDCRSARCSRKVPPVHAGSQVECFHQPMEGSHSHGWVSGEVEHASRQGREGNCTAGRIHGAWRAVLLPSLAHWLKQRRDQQDGMAWGGGRRSGDQTISNPPAAFLHCHCLQGKAASHTPHTT